MRSSLLSALLLASVSLLTGPLGQAQTALQVNNNESTPTPGVGHDYIHSLSETVNPGNGSLSIQIQVPVPAARGFTVPFNLAYGSNGVSHMQPTSPPGTVTWVSDAAYLSQQGWSYTTPLLSYYKTFSSAKWKVQNGIQIFSTCYYLGNFIFLDATGGRHSLYLADLPSNQSDQTYCHQATTPTSSYLSSGPVNDQEGGYQAYLVPGVDSSQVYVASPEGTVYSFQVDSSLPHINNDGSPSIPPTAMYSLPSIEDRNGNGSGLSAGAGAINVNGVPIWAPITYIDSLGRTPISTSGFGASGNTITVSGLSNPYTVTWGATTFSDSPPYTLGSQKIDTWSYCPSSIGGFGVGSSPTPTQPINTITLPNGQKFQFLYDSTSGLLGKIIYPGGGYVQYVWGPNRLSDLATFPSSQVNPVAGPACEDRYDTVAVTHRYVSFDGTNIALQQDFSYSTTWDSSNPTLWDSKQTIVTTHDLVQGITYQTVYNYSPRFLGAPPNAPYTYSAPQIPMEQSVVYQAPNGSVLRTENKAWADLTSLASHCVTLDNNQTSGTFFTYNTADQITDEKEFDFGIIQPGACTLPSSTPTRETVFTYQSLPNTPIYGNAPSILDRPCSVVTKDSSGNVAAETDYLYDNAATVCGTAGTPSVASASATQHDETNYGPSSTAPRGNATTITRKCLQSCTNSVTTYAYDETGHTASMTDPRGNQTTYSYADNFDSNPPSNTNAFLTQITLPATNGVNHIEKFKYAYADGQLIQSTDQNNQITSYLYSDPLRRLTETDFPDGGKITLAYNDSPYNPSTPSPSVTAARAITSTTNLTALTAFDGLGHTVRSVLTSDPDCANGDRTDTTYDGLGHVYTVSNPYCTTADTTYGLTTYTYDALGRTTQITHPDNSTVLTTFTGRATQVQDEGNGTQRVTRISQSDGLGRLASLCEVASAPFVGAGGASSSSLIGSGGAPVSCGQDIAGTGFLTTYGYDVLGNLLNVNQSGIAARTYTYDSLSRLVSASNPESGSFSYTYDANGNLVTKTAPAPNQTGTATVTTCFGTWSGSSCGGTGYDALNRVTQKSYSDGTTATATFTYDSSSSTNGIGRMTGASVTVPAYLNGCIYTSRKYDSMGRITQDFQAVPDGACVGYTIPYAYDLMGNMTSADYEFTYAYNTAARLTSLTNSFHDANNPATLISGMHYTAFGGLTTDTLGDNEIETYSYVPKLTRLQSYTANYNNSPIYSWSLTSFAPNGDILAATDTANGNWNYSYDQFNRLVCATTTGTCATPPTGTPSYTYVYDRFGNRWQQNGSHSMQLTFTGNSPSNPQNNNRMDGYSYDAAGNLINDGAHNYFYDAENHLMQVDGSSGYCNTNAGTAGTACYFYDAFGRRVYRTKYPSDTCDNDGIREVIYDLSDRPVAEAFNGTSCEIEIYAGGRHLANQGGGTMFAHADWLGTLRFEVPYSFISNPWYYRYCSGLPFGEELGCQNSSHVANNAQTRLRFTGKPHDDETNLDYFDARFDASSFGRFMSADQLGPGQHPENPQTWNLYSYVLNNPLKLVDPSGEFVCDAKTVSNQECDKVQEALDKAQDAADALGKKYGWDSEQYLNAQRAIDAYGDEGIDNGVVIAQGDTGGHGATTTDASKAFPGEKILVTLDKAQDTINSSYLPITAAHEGTHVADDMSWLTNGRSDAKWVSLGLSPGLPQTIYQFELKGYSVGFNIAEGLGMPSLSFDHGKYDFPLPLTPAGIDRAEIMIKTDYENWNVRIFQRNTNPSRSQR